MSGTNLFVSCPNIQDLLDNNFNTNGSSMQVDAHPFLDYLLSPVNRSGFSQRVVPGQGKIRTVEMTYDQLIGESEVTQPGTTDRTCAATTQRGNLSTSCTIDPADYWEVEEKLTVADFTYICQNNQDVVAKKIQKLINALRSKIATTVTSQSAAFIGGLSSDVVSGNKVDVGGINYMKVATLDSSGNVNPKALQKIAFIKQQMNWSMPSPIFTNGDLYEYAMLMQAGCCSTSGLDLSQILAQYGTAVLYDRRVGASSGGAAYAWTVAPGALQVVFHVENDNGIAEAAGITSGANYQKQVIFDPTTGMPIDFTISDNCGDISLITRTNAKVCALPTDLYPNGYHMDGITWMAGIKVVNP